MPDIHRLVADNIHLWTSAVKTKSAAGRGSNNKLSLHGIQKLRELILELAVRGKLVPQDPNDEPAAVLLKKIEDEKNKLNHKNSTKILLHTDKNIAPYKLPKNWEWCKLSDIYYSISPSSNKLKSSEIFPEGEFPVVDQGQSFISGYSNNANLVINIPGPVIIFGDHTTQRKYIDFDFIAGADGTKILRPYKMNERYFYIYLLSYKLENRGYARHFKVLNSQLFGVPPLAEQERIVSKVDELMALCDRLKKQTVDSIAAHQALVEALLATLTQSQNADELSQNWARVSEYFDVLFTTEQSIEQLKQTILQLAVMGKLVPQDHNDEPASELLKKIDAEKSKLIKEGTIKKQKPLLELKNEEKFFDLPVGWAWARLNDCYDVRDGTHDSPKPQVTGYPLVTSKNLSSGKLDLSNISYISQEDHVKIQERSKVDKSDILFAMIGSIGNPVIVDIEREFSIKNVALFKYYDIDFSSPKYLLYFLENASRKIREESSGAVQSFVSLGALRSVVIALPPLAEQQRIVVKVDELIDLCDQLKERLSGAQSIQNNLADAIVEKSVA